MPSKIQTLAIVAAVAYGTASTMALPVRDPYSLNVRGYDGLEVRSYGDDYLRFVARQDAAAAVVTPSSTTSVAAEPPTATGAPTNAPAGAGAHAGSPFAVWWHNLWHPNHAISNHNGTASTDGKASTTKGGAQSGSSEKTKPADAPTGNKEASKGDGSAGQDAPQSLAARDGPNTAPAVVASNSANANGATVSSHQRHPYSVGSATESVPADRSSSRFQIPEGMVTVRRRKAIVRNEATRPHYLARHQLPDPTVDDASVPPMGSGSGISLKSW